MGHSEIADLSCAVSKSESVRFDPAALNLACLSHGARPIALDKPFTYYVVSNETSDLDALLDPLCGAYTHGQFVGISFSALTDCNFQLCNGGKADIVMLHGCLSAASPAQQESIAQFLLKQLKPGALACITYPSLPGSAPRIFLRNLLLQYCAHSPDERGSALAEAVNWINRLVACGAQHFEEGSLARRHWQALCQHDPLQACAQVISDTAQPLRARDVHNVLAEAKLDFIGSADHRSIGNEALRPTAQRGLLDASASAGLRQTYIDIFDNTSYRCDLFVRGARALTAQQMQWWMQHFYLQLNQHAYAEPLLLSPGAQHVAQLLRVRPHTLTQIHAGMIARGVSTAQATLSSACEVIGANIANVSCAGENA